jgi:MFS family permease
MFTVPSNGKVMYMCYSVLHNVGTSGISISLINLTYEVVPREQRTSAYAVTNAMAGISGFVVTLILNPVFKAIQGAGNVVFGIPMYAQQFFAFIAVVALVIIVLWVGSGIRKKEKAQKLANEKN